MNDLLERNPYSINTQTLSPHNDTDEYVFHDDELENMRKIYGRQLINTYEPKEKRKYFRKTLNHILDSHRPNPYQQHHHESNVPGYTTNSISKNYENNVRLEAEKPREISIPIIKISKTTKRKPSVNPKKKRKTIRKRNKNTRKRRKTASNRHSKSAHTK